MADKWIPRKATIAEGSAAFQEGASRQKDSTTAEKDMLDAPLPKGSMMGSSKNPINSGQKDIHYNGGTVKIPASSELGSNR
jgi:hypothetical protein